MGTSVLSPTTLSQVSCRLDELSIRSLDLMEGIITRRTLIEKLMKEAFINMAKARYNMGNRSVSSLQLPTEDSVVRAKHTVVGKTVHDGSVPFTEFSLLSLESGRGNADQGLRLRSAAVDGKTPASPTDDQSSSEDGVAKEKKIQDPLHWFGVLVPASLRECQKGFTKALEMVCDIASLQSELSGVCKEYRELRKQKSKLKCLEEKQ